MVYKALVGAKVIILNKNKQFKIIERVAQTLSLVVRYEHINVS